MNVKGHLGRKCQTTMRQVEVELAKTHGVELWKVQRHAEAGMKFAQLAGAGDFSSFLITECVLMF
jgi:hypothetical protein